jgi:hypothetical protein
MNAKRHLPVLREPSENDGPRWSSAQWAFAGALGIFLLWLPLAMVGLWISRISGVFVLGPLLVSFSLAAFFGAALVGRYESNHRRSTPVFAGLLASLGIVLLAAVQGALRPLAMVVLVQVVLGFFAAIFAYWGGRWGERFRG